MVKSSKYGSMKVDPLTRVLLYISTVKYKGWPQHLLILAELRYNFLPNFRYLSNHVPDHDFHDVPLSLPPCP